MAIIYDSFQKEAIEYINQGSSVIVSAPTGAGKTAIAEHIILSCIQNKVGVIYTAPLKALSNQKFRDFQTEFGENIGILTGDVSLNPNALVLIMTTEIFRNKILDEPESLGRYSWVIFDEVHYIDNPERGTVWEESLIFLPKHMNILGLSATIPNINQFAQWLQFLYKKPIKIVSEEKRPVPLHFFFQYQNQIVHTIDNLKKRVSETYQTNKLNALINYIQQKEGLPCIYFVFGRKRVEDLAFDLSNYNFLNPNEQTEVLSLYDSLCQRFDLNHEKSANILLPLIKKGIAYHHAGMLPTLKEAVERLFTSKLLKVIFTTETFALGINMPARSVVFDDLIKFYGRYKRLLKTRDFYQMAGRAGRRGMDKEGFVYCRINPRINPEEIKRIIYGPPEEVHSQLNASYATILNLYEKYKEDLFNIYPLSLHYFQSKKYQQKEALRLIGAKLSLLKELKYIRNENLTHKGKFAKSVYGYELMLSQLYEQNLFERLDESELGILAVAIVFEPRKNQRSYNLSKTSRNLKRICEQTYDKIKDMESKYRIYPFSKMPYFHLGESINNWLKRVKFSNVLQFTDTDEGEVVRYFRMGVQVLREILEAEVTSYILKERLRKTISIINRDIVDAERQLHASVFEKNDRE